MKSITVYEYDELPDERAKERARDWYLSALGDTDFAEFVTDEFAELLEACGFTVNRVRGGSSALAIYWRLSPVEGGFEATWRADDVEPERVARMLEDRPETWTDAHGTVRPCEGNQRTAKSLRSVLALATDYPTGSGTVSAGRDGFTVSTDFTGFDDDTDEDSAGAYRFDAICKDLAHDFACAVDAEYTYQTSEEVVADNIRANAYTFTADGRREG